MTGRQRRSQTARLLMLIILLLLLIWLLWRVFMAVPPAPRPKVTTGALPLGLRARPVLVSGAAVFTPAQGILN